MKRFAPFAALFAVMFLFAIVQFVYIMRRIEPSEGMGLLMSSGMALSFVCWMMADAHQRSRVPCFDFGFLAGVFFPISLIWYVFWSRGWKGMFTLILLLIIFLVPFLIATIVLSAVIFFGGANGMGF